MKNNQTSTKINIFGEHTQYFFEQNENQWYWFGDTMRTFVKSDTQPKLTNNFAGIGTREINENGKNAIKGVYAKTFAKPSQ